ncbi:MAG: S8 family serine peptidase [Acidobacteria bacterium]|nr:S8 family serine peptidase [Acidobacteriota bacterium]
MKRLLIPLLIPVLLISIVPKYTTGDQGKLGRQLQSILEDAPSDRTQAVWVYFTDKGPNPELRAGETRAVLTPGALARRARKSKLPSLIGFEDLPLQRAYVSEVTRSAARLRNELRWFNAVSIDATPAQIRSIEQLPFVARVDIVRGYRKAKVDPPHPVDAATYETETQSTARPAEAHEINYGQSFCQLNQIKVPPVHDLGIDGSGVIVAMFDAGFNNLAHEAFATLRVLATRDFVNGGENVGDAPNLEGSGGHGTNTLSTIAGFKEGRLIGPAFGSSYLLAKTENTESETPLEEDNWAAAAEWAEGLGADLISTSLGYLDFDAPFTSYTYQDMDGMTAISTRAADMAAARGVVVVSSAGNDGFSFSHNTLGAPADGIKVITAGAVSAFGARSFFSSIGPTADGRIKPDVMAQGSGVMVASSFLRNQYGLADGTSFACPLTAGVAALILQAHPDYTVDQVITVLRLTATNASQPNSLIGWGIVNALAAIQAPPPAP